MAGQSTPATTLLDRRGVSYQLHTYTPNPRAGSYGADAAEALGLAPQRVFKTLVAELDGRLMVAVVPVSGELDLRALAAVVGTKKGTRCPGGGSGSDRGGDRNPFVSAFSGRIDDLVRPQDADRDLELRGAV